MAMTGYNCAGDIIQRAIMMTSLGFHRHFSKKYNSNNHFTPSVLYSLQDARCKNPLLLLSPLPGIKHLGGDQEVQALVLHPLLLLLQWAGLHLLLLCPLFLL